MSSHGIIIDQKYNIKDTIPAKLFTDATKQVNSTPTPFKAYRTFEIYLADTLPDTPY